MIRPPESAPYRSVGGLISALSDGGRPVLDLIDLTLDHPTRVGRTTRAFNLPAGSGRGDASPDGSRVLVIQNTASNTNHTIVITNWQSLLDD